MFTAITVLIIIICILLVLVVLVQNPKGGGVASGIIGANQLMGVKKTTDFIEKLTWGLVIGLVSLCLLAGFALPKKGDREIGTKMQEQIDAGAAPTTTPAAPQQPAQQPAQQQPAQGEPAQQQPAQ
ncbi:MAG: preprotein translocase subunit SecG [Bacteroidota bacterium]|mgnify:FL=1|jgi:preprotein translocase subunit SecG|uniref:preprotein translocase subunit SecG n=1 Tax=Candidatus Pollutiaquabacter sp. TaxID=3416354 RepID=UPI001A45C9C2|nr:preprotein translocase subunit SecG [Bacteroidota bacterium]MBL7947690.1 preprotein translocase subunit SecG [Bacteroidia bacterium]MBP7269950.1 preprotein translocase subunit SecG [Bacteroidia bacterium]MBP7436213.1 preprotein translocase subunit SecG [Bacteroidia bacterium]MBP7728243.1 preprotein translocase subunit SecG [Bacteroidia bacterium]